MRNVTNQGNGGKLVLAVLIWAWVAMAAPFFPTGGVTTIGLADGGGLAKRGFDCTNLTFGLTTEDCIYMSTIGIAGQGQNDLVNNGYVWLGNQGGPNVFSFSNRASVPIILLMWTMEYASDFGSMCLNVRKPMISMSLKPLEGVYVSAENGVTGAWSALYDHQTQLNQYGQVCNTWGEFTTGDYGVVDISREVHMGGNVMDAILSPTGCVTDFNRCVYVCKTGDTCGQPDTYALENCEAGSQNGAGTGSAGGQPSGGCFGFMNTNGARLDASFY